jgi:HEAT repeat protein
VYDFDMPRLLLLLLLAFPAAGAQMPPVGIIDVYGLRTVSGQQVRAALGFAEGDTFPGGKEQLEQRLAKIPGVVRARISGVCCDQGRSIIYIGIEEAGSAAPRFRTAPTGPVRLPAEIVRAGAALDVATRAAVLRGEAGEDRTRGYSLMKDSTARAIQERFVSFANGNAALLSQVLRNSSDADHRALAAQVIGYGSDRAAVIRELVEAMRDPSSNVRNNAMRALGIIALYAREHPDLKLSVPSAPFIDMLNSPVWTDRNKSSIAVMELSESRDPVLLAELRERALPALVEMARWKSEGHASASIMILGRMVGMTDGAIIATATRGDREAIIDAATKAGDRKAPPA